VTRRRFALLVLPAALVSAVVAYAYLLVALTAGALP
jgi:hypothetical protein